LIESMPRPRLPYLQKETSRHGKTVWYVRAPSLDGARGKRIRVKGEFGSPEFMASYQAAMRGEGPPRRGKPAGGTLAWLIERYRESAAWAVLKPATQKQRENIFKHVCQGAGSNPAASIEKRHIAAGRDRRAKTPGAANNYLKTMRALFSWAVESDLLKIDPTREVKRVPVKSDGFYSWTPEDVERFRRHWPIGARQRLAMEILLHTGLRRGDAVRLGRQHIRNGVIMLRTEKTGAWVHIPILPELQKVIEASPIGDLALIARIDGTPFTKWGFGNWFGDACRDAGIPGNAHGLRKALSTLLAEKGATEPQMNAVMGWADGSKESATYIRKANREQMAAAALAKIGGENKSQTSIPAPVSKVRASSKKKENKQ
jgi:integrase